MAGEAKTNAVLLGTATVMLGPTNKLWELTPATHGIGLVKNVRASSEATYTELKQGVKQNTVYSVQTDNPTKISMEVYEYTGKNLSYALGLDGSTLAAQTDLTLKTAISSGGTSVVADATVDPGFVSGDWVIIQDKVLTDRVHVGQLNAGGTFSTNQVTLTLTSTTAMPTGMTFAVGSRVSRVNQVKVGAQVAQPYFACKIVGVLPEKDQPVVMLYPKVRITRGFDLSWVVDNYGNMPFEITPYQLTSSDDNFAVFGGRLGDCHVAF